MDPITLHLSVTWPWWVKLAMRACVLCSPLMAWFVARRWVSVETLQAAYLSLLTRTYRVRLT